MIINIALTGEDAGNYILANLGQGRTRASITAKPLEIDDSEITVTRIYDGTGNPGTLKGALKLKGVIGGEVGLDMSNVIAGSYSDADIGENKTVILSGIGLAGSKTAKKNYSIPSTYTFREAGIIAKPLPMLDAHFTVAIPKASAYDGQPREAAVRAENGAVLGKATVAYARQRADGAYDAPTTERPVNAGAYKVIVSFEESADFAAAEGRNAIEAGTLTIIRRVSGAASADITVPAAAVRTVRLDELGLESGMAQGVKLKKAPSVTDNEVLKEVTGAAGKTFFTLETNRAEGTRSQTFELVLRSDNYAELTVSVTINADADAINICPPETASSLTFPYGTPLKDILELTGGSAALNGENIPGTFALKEPDKLYEVGTYANENIEVLFNSDDGVYQDYPITVHAGFTITEVIDEFAPIYLMIYANSDYNGNKEMLRSFVAEKKPAYTAENAVTLRARWSADGSTPFQPRGKAENVWYSYTADLTAEDGGFDVSGIDKPKAYVRVIPVNAAPTLEKSSGTLTAAAVKALSNEGDMRAALGLPDRVSVTYAPAETFEWTAEAFTETSGEYAISGWRMDGRPLTPAALKKKAARAARRDVEVTLTPTYDLPGWATITDTPTFKLTITPKVLADTQ